MILLAPRNGNGESELRVSSNADNDGFVIAMQCMNAGRRGLDYMCNERSLWIVTEVPRH